MSFRQEFKIRVSNSDFLILKSKLFQLGMKKLYSKRIINSTYFDTLDFRMFHESQESILPRKKVRVRWYDKNQKQLSKEIKITSIEGRFKKISNISEMEFILLKKNGVFENGYNKLYPTLNIKYFREYMNYMDLRITFDSNIQYHFNNCYYYNDFENVIEIKTSLNKSINIIEKIIPIKISRFSKYCRGLLIQQKQAT